MAKPLWAVATKRLTKRWSRPRAAVLSTFASVQPVNPLPRPPSLAAGHFVHVKSCAMLSTTVSVVTGIAWLLLLLVLFAAGQRITFDGVIALINDAVVFAMFGVVVASVCFAYRPRRWLAVVLFLISLLAASVSGYTLWTHISFFHFFGGSYLERLHTIPGEWRWLCVAVIFITLALLWGVLCWRLRDVDTST